jgi:hypothetical protein
MRRLHRQGGPTSYEVAAVNSKTGDRIFVAVVAGGKSRRVLRRVIFRELTSGETRLDRVNRMIDNTALWTWKTRAADGIFVGDWTIKFTGRTAKDIDQAGEGRSIYSAEGRGEVAA